MMNPLTYNINYSINLNIKYKVKALTHDFLLGKNRCSLFLKRPIWLGEQNGQFLAKS